MQLRFIPACAIYKKFVEARFRVRIILRAGFSMHPCYALFQYHVIQYNIACHVRRVFPQECRASKPSRDNNAELSLVVQFFNEDEYSS